MNKAHYSLGMLDVVYQMTLVCYSQVLCVSNKWVVLCSVWSSCNSVDPLYISSPVFCVAVSVAKNFTSHQTPCAVSQHYPRLASLRRARDTTAFTTIGVRSGISVRRDGY